MTNSSNLEELFAFTPLSVYKLVAAWDGLEFKDKIKALVL